MAGTQALFHCCMFVRREFLEPAQKRQCQQAHSPNSDLSVGARCGTGSFDPDPGTNAVHQPPAQQRPGREGKVQRARAALSAGRSARQGLMQGVSEAAFSFANFLGPILGSYVAGAGEWASVRVCGGGPTCEFYMLASLSIL